MKIEIFSDIACPWCYIGKVRLEDAIKELGCADSIEIEYRSFELSPEKPATVPMTHAALLSSMRGISLEEARGLEKQTEDVAAADGIVMDFGKLKLFNTRPAHQLLHLAKRHGIQRALEDSLFKAAFSEGVQLGDVDQLVAVAVGTGLDEGECRAVLREGRFIQDVIADEQEAARIGARGVPYMVFDGKYALSGAQSKQVFRQALAAVLEDREQSSDARVCASDDCAI